MCLNSLHGWISSVSIYLAVYSCLYSSTYYYFELKVASIFYILWNHTWYRILFVARFQASRILDQMGDNRVFGHLHLILACTVLRQLTLLVIYCVYIFIYNFYIFKYIILFFSLNWLQFVIFSEIISRYDISFVARFWLVGHSYLTILLNCSYIKDKHPVGI